MSDCDRIDTPPGRYRTAVSAKNHVDEKDKLRKAFESEVLFLQSLGQIYLSSDGAPQIMNDNELDKVGIVASVWYIFTNTLISLALGNPTLQYLRANASCIPRLCPSCAGRRC